MEHYVRTGSVRSSDPVPRQIKPFNYPTSKCVLQHFEANTRLLLASYCPLLRNRHMTVPLKINYLSFGSHGAIQVNDYDHVFVYDRNFSFLRHSAVFKEGQYPLFGHLPHYYQSQDCQQFIKMFLLKGLTPFVSMFHTAQWQGRYTVPKFRVKQLLCSANTLDNVHSFFDPESFPVEKFTMAVGGPEDDILKWDLSKLTDFLRIEVLDSYSSPMWGQTLSNIRMDTVQVYVRKDFISIDNLAELAQNWMETSKEAGTKYTFQYRLRSIDFLQRLSNRITELTGIPSSQDDYHEYFSFEMDNNKKLIIYLESGPYEKLPSYHYWVTFVLAMEIV